MNYEPVTQFIKKTFNTDHFIPLHEPRFIGNEKAYLNECIDSTYVSSVGKFVDQFEAEFARTVGTKYAIATVNGTAALHVALLLAGVNNGDEVITQPLTFIATANAISYAGASPIFVDVDLDTMGLSPQSLKYFLEQNCEVIQHKCINRTNRKIIKACVPMHTFGHPCRIDEIKSICDEWHLALVEDAAESLGSYYRGQHTGTFGCVGVFSFNGNKIITSGGGGVIVTNDEALAKRAKHITTTAKIPHKWEYVHDEVAYNYRLPNLNAALLCAQLENLEKFLANKYELASIYERFFANTTMTFVKEPQNAHSNYWLQSILLENRIQRDEFLTYTNENNVMTRPIWTLMTKLDMYKECQHTDLNNALFLEDRIVNIPSSVRL